MNTVNLEKKLNEICEAIVKENRLSATYQPLLIKCVHAALRNSTLKEYNQENLNEYVRAIRSASDRYVENKLLDSIYYEFAWQICNKTIIPVLHAEFIAKNYMPIILQEVCNEINGQFMENWLEYLGIDYNNTMAKKRTDLFKDSKREFYESFSNFKMVA